MSRKILILNNSNNYCWPTHGRLNFEFVGILSRYKERLVERVRMKWEQLRREDCAVGDVEAAQLKRRVVQKLANDQPKSNKIGS